MGADFRTVLASSASPPEDRNAVPSSPPSSAIQSRLDRIEEFEPDARVEEALAVGEVGIWSWNLRTDVFAADPVARRLWGLPEHGPIAIAPVLAAIHPGDVAAVRSAVATMSRPGSERQVVFRLRHESGDLRWLRLRGRLVDDDRGRRLVGVTIDETERKRTEAELAATEARLRRAQELGGALPFEWDARSDAVVAGTAFRELYGLAPYAPLDLDSILARVHPDDRQRVEENRARRLAEPGPFEFEFRILHPDGAERWLLARGETILDEHGTPVGLAGLNMDITARKEAEAELKRSKRQAQARFRELKALYQNAPVGLALLDPDLRFLRVNTFLAEINGLAPDAHTGRSVFEFFPDWRSTVEPLLRRILAGGEPARDVDVEGATLGRPDTPLVWRTQFYPLKDESGAVVGIGVVAEDVTARRRAEQARDLLGRELSHRIKNLFAVVSSLIRLSARGDERLQAFARMVVGRIEALGRAHDYVRPGEWNAMGRTTPTLHRLLDTLLAPYRDGDENRIRIGGDDLPIGPSAATTLALAVHEFATNAVKYGALSGPGGSVEIACRRHEDGVSLVWSERGGPAVTGPPEREGFGSLLARRSLAGDLGGTVDLDWRPDGLIVRIAAAAERLRR